MLLFSISFQYKISAFHTSFSADITSPHLLHCWERMTLFFFFFLLLVKERARGNEVGLDERGTLTCRSVVPMVFVAALG